MCHKSKSHGQGAGQRYEDKEFYESSWGCKVATRQPQAVGVTSTSTSASTSTSTSASTTQNATNAAATVTAISNQLLIQINYDADTAQTRHSDSK